MAVSDLGSPTATRKHNMHNLHRISVAGFVVRASHIPSWGQSPSLRLKQLDTHSEGVPGVAGHRHVCLMLPLRRCQKHLRFQMIKSCFPEFQSSRASLVTFKLGFRGLWSAQDIIQHSAKGELQVARLESAARQMSAFAQSNRLRQLASLMVARNSPAEELQELRELFSGEAPRHLLTLHLGLQHTSCSMGANPVHVISTARQPPLLCTCTMQMASYSRCRRSRVQA